MSSSGKTQHFDCCIRRFESCHPSQKITDTKLCLLFFCLDFRQDSNRLVHLLRSKRDIKLLQATRLALSDSATPATSSQATYRLRRFFYRLALIPLLLLSETGHAQVACSVVNALTTAHCRYQLLRFTDSRKGCPYGMIYNSLRAKSPLLFTFHSSLFTLLFPSGQAPAYAIQSIPNKRLPLQGSLCNFQNNAIEIKPDYINYNTYLIPRRTWDIF